MPGYSVTIEDKEMHEALQAFGDSRKLPQTVLRAFREGVLVMVAHVTKNKMRGQYINRRTGTGIRSVTASPFDEIRGNEVIAGFGSHLGYIRALDRGFKGTVQVRAHTRRLITNRGRSGRVTKKATRAAKRKLRRGNKRFAQVRAHGRRVNIQARHFFRDTLADKRLKVGALTLRALRLLARNGRVPTVGEVRGA